jgi:hypothetical protein
MVALPIQYVGNGRGVIAWGCRLVGVVSSRGVVVAWGYLHMGVSSRSSLFPSRRRSACVVGPLASSSPSPHRRCPRG